MDDASSPRPAPPVAVAARKTSKVPRRLRRFLALDDFERYCARKLPRSIFGYVQGGAETEQSLTANHLAFQQISLLPRVLRDVSDRHHRCRLFGVDHAVPFAVAPMGFSALAAFDGDVALARGAADRGTFAVCSASSFTPLERVALEAQSRWFQAYLPGDDARVSALLDRLLANNFNTLVVTADVPVAANRETNARNGFDAPFRLTPDLVWQGLTHPHWTLGTLGREMATRGMPHFENMEAVQGPPLFSRTLVRSTIARDRLSWQQVALIRKRWPGQLVIKGVLHPADAELARDHGADGIIVSNHGGRQLDGALASLAALGPIRQAVPDMTVMVDSGIRRGTDVLKALALGADFVFVGRPFLYAAAAAGAAGVAHACDLLSAEISRDMAMLGLVSLDEVGPHILAP